MQVRYAPLSSWARSVSSIRLTASAGCRLVAVKRIEETLRAQLESGAYRTCTVPMPPKFEIIIRYKEHRAAYRCSFYPGVEQVDEKTLRFTCVDYMDAMCLFQFVL